ncbi:MAG: OmpA family protein [Planctomycetota bacterium]
MSIRSNARHFGPLILGALGGTLVLGSGCENQPTAEEVTLLDALQQENMELRQANEDLNNALNSAQDQAAELAGERDQLFTENTDLRDQLDQRGGGDSGGLQSAFGQGFDVSGRPGELVVTIAGDVLFSSGSATLKRDARRELDEVARVLNSSYAGNTIRVAGHTDSDPIRKSQWKTNERLSTERALAVEEYLVTRGVSSDRMYVAGFGSSQPRGTKAQSRRVEIVIIEGGS